MLLPRNIFTCKYCNREYITYREKSDYCSIECRKAARPKLMYNCDYCGKEFKVIQSRLDRLNKGGAKKLYCSRECADLGQRTKVKINCEWCGKEFEISNCAQGIAKYCSRQCYLEHGSRPNKCKYCGEEFKPNVRSQMYCSQECQFADMYPSRIECQCETCGKPLSLKPSEYNAAKHHYCSQECHYNDITWSEADRAILQEWYGKKNNYEIGKMLSKSYTVGAIKSAAGRYGIIIKERWTPEEERYVLEHFENTPFSVIKEHLPNRSESAIIGKARAFNLKSLAYNTSRWTEEEEEILRELYPITKTKVVAEKLGRSVNSCIQRANILGVFKDARIGECYTNLSQYIRSQNAAFHVRQLKQNNYTCQITGRVRDVVIHHIYGFNLILAEALDLSGIELKYDFSDFTVDELQKIFELFTELQDSYNQTICISKELHIKFHNKYGYGNNTPEQWEEFIKEL